MSVSLEKYQYRNGKKYSTIAGLAITQAKRTLQHGDTVKVYTKGDLAHGRNMMVASILALVVGTILLYDRI